MFAWGADNKVVRLYPMAAQRELTIEAGDVVILPAQGESAIKPQPLPGNLEDHEALIVVATTENVDYGKVAPIAGGSLNETMERAVDGGRFLSTLASMDPSRMSVTVLSYQVHI